MSAGARAAGRVDDGVNRRARHARLLERAREERQIVRLVVEYQAATFIAAGARARAWGFLRQAQTIRQCYELAGVPR